LMTVGGGMGSSYAWPELTHILARSAAVSTNNTAWGMRCEKALSFAILLIFSLNYLSNPASQPPFCVSFEERPTCAYSIDRKVSND
jgi:hypothetical protein